MSTMNTAGIITEQYLAEFFQINIDEARVIHQQLEPLFYYNNEAIVTQGDAADGIYFLEEGQASVFNADGEAVNELSAGQYFGEYAILANEPRMTTVRAHGKVLAYRLSSEAFLAVVGRHPAVFGRLLKQVYGQISVKHTQLASLTRKSRGIMWSPQGYKDSKFSHILITYGSVAAVFLLVFFSARHIDTANAPSWWQLLPLGFLMAFTLRTKRIIEGMLLTVFLLSGMLHQGNFLLGFEDTMIKGIGNPDTSSTIIIMAMVEAFAALLAASGIVTAFRKLAEKHVHSESSSLFGMLFIMIAACLDECLNVVTAGYCMNELSDAQNVPRESRALLGSCSTAICSLIPFSLWGAYISAWISIYFDDGNIFLKSIPFNLASIFAVVMSLLLCSGRLPKSEQLKQAYKRVKEGGKAWPQGSERYFETIDDEGIVGRPINLLLPMLVWAASSVICGMINSQGDFSMEPISGLVITLVFTFLLYVGQRLMTPKAFFEILSNGIGNALMPILLLVFAERIAAGLDELQFVSFLEKTIVSSLGGQLFLIPVCIFILCTLICVGISSMWGMYGLGIPISMYLAIRLGVSIPLCLGAALAAGIMGESLCPYIDETAPAVCSIGCEPRAYRKLRLQYWSILLIVCIIGYLILGIIFV